MIKVKTEAMDKITSLVYQIQKEQITVKEADNQLLFLLGVSSSLNFGVTPTGRKMDSIYDYICVRSDTDAFWAYKFCDQTNFLLRRDYVFDGVIPLQEHAKKWWGVWAERQWKDHIGYERISAIDVETGVERWLN